MKNVALDIKMQRVVVEVEMKVGTVWGEGG